MLGTLPAHSAGRPARRGLAGASLALLGAAFGALVLLGPPASQARGEGAYPDLRATPPSDLRVEQTAVDGANTWVLRFSTLIGNFGGRLELEGRPSGDRVRVYQRIYDAGGTNVVQTRGPIGEFVYHPQHNHMHFEDWAENQLWRRSDWDAWSRHRAPGRQKALAVSSKESFCIRDDIRLVPTAGPSLYGACTATTQGLSAGWADLYKWDLYGQWVVLGQAPLADGEYALRIVADPKRRIYESPNNDRDLDGDRSNEGVTFFRASGGAITVTGSCGPC